MTIRTVLVDDEPLATQGLQLRLEAHDDVETVATAANGREAIRAIKTHKPDLVFLDIQMPGFDGFSVIQGLMDVEPPLFVFVTAYGDHALRAFEAQAVDYLMKPVEEDRLAATLDRVRQRLSEKRSAEEAERLKEALAEHAPEAAEEMADASPEGPASNRFEKMINIKDQGQIFRVDVDTIERIDAAGDYMCIQTGDNTLILRETMKDLEKRLDPRRFQRVHRSTIVNLDLVKQVKPHTNGECFLVLDFRRAGEGEPVLSGRCGALRPLVAAATAVPASVATVTAGEVADGAYAVQHREGVRSEREVADVDSKLPAGRVLIGALGISAACGAAAVAARVLAPHHFLELGRLSAGGRRQDEEHPCRLGKTPGAIRLMAHESLHVARVRPSRPRPWRYAARLQQCARTSRKG